MSTTLLSAREVARRYGISERRVRQLAISRRAGMKVAGVWMFTPRDVLKMRPRPTGRPPSKRRLRQ